MISHSVQFENSSVRPELVEGQINDLDSQIEILDDCIKDLNTIDLDDWRLAAALCASQALCLAKACVTLWRSEEPMTLAIASIFRSFLEAYVNFLYLQKYTAAGFKNLMLAGLHEELRAMADGELLNVLSAEEKVKRRLEIKSLINEHEALEAKNINLEARMFKIWGGTNKLVYEYYRTLSAASHSRLTWFFRTLGTEDQLSLIPKSDDHEKFGQIVLMTQALQNISLGLAVIEPQLITQ